MQRRTPPCKRLGTCASHSLEDEVFSPLSQMNNNDGPLGAVLPVSSSLPSLSDMTDSAHWGSPPQRAATMATSPPLRPAARSVQRHLSQEEGSSTTQLLAVQSGNYKNPRLLLAEDSETTTTGDGTNVYFGRWINTQRQLHPKNLPKENMYFPLDPNPNPLLSMGQVAEKDILYMFPQVFTHERANGSTLYGVPTADFEKARQIKLAGKKKALGAPPNNRGGGAKTGDESGMTRSKRSRSPVVITISDSEDDGDDSVFSWTAQPAVPPPPPLSTPLAERELKHKLTVAEAENKRMLQAQSEQDERTEDLLQATSIAHFAQIQAAKAEGHEEGHALGVQHAEEEHTAALQDVLQQNGELWEKAEHAAAEAERHRQRCVTLEAEAQRQAEQKVTILANLNDANQRVLADGGHFAVLAADGRTAQAQAALQAQVADTEAARNALPTCCLCLEEPLVYAMQPCGHMGVCDGCKQGQQAEARRQRKSDKCAVCRKKCSFLKVYGTL